MTALGIVTLVAVGVTWLVRRDALQYVLAVTAVFPQSAALVIGDKGFPLFYLAIAVTIVLAAPRLLMLLARPGAGTDPLRPRRRWADVLIVALLVWAAVISYAGPRIFAGLPVFDPSLGVDVQVGALTPLAPTLGNMAQVGYLGLAAAFLLLAGRLFPVDRRMVAVLVWATVLLAGARLALGPLWPLELTQTMPGLPYQNGDRLAGTFYEPSVLGMYLTACAGWFGAQLLTARARIAPVAGLALVAVEFVANGSGTALMGVVLVTGLGCVVLFVRMARSGSLRVRPAFVAGGLALAAVALTQIPALLALTVGAVETKTGTSSWVARNASNDRSIGIVLDTLGLGVGLGGNRPSSLPLFVVSCLGVIGAAVLVVLVVIALRRGIAAGQVASVWALVGALTAGAVAVPDLSTPLLWVGLAACVVGGFDMPAVQAARPPGVPEGVGALR